MTSPILPTLTLHKCLANTGLAKKFVVFFRRMGLRVLSFTSFETVLLDYSVTAVISYAFKKT